jgi:chemotaxis signal transduction protein
VTTAQPSRAEILRLAFDRGFAAPPQPAAEDTERLVAIRVGPDPYAVRVTEISGLFADKKIVPVPTPLPALLGVTGLRSGIVAVYSLRALLGQAPASDTPRWLFATAEVALAFDALDGYARVAPSEIARTNGGTAAEHVRATVRIGGALCSLVSVESVVEEIKRRVAAVGTIKER